MKKIIGATIGIIASLVTVFQMGVTWEKLVDELKKCRNETAEFERLLADLKSAVAEKEVGNGSGIKLGF